MSGWKIDPIGWKIVAIGDDGSVLCESESGELGRYWFQDCTVSDNESCIEEVSDKPQTIEPGQEFTSKEDDLVAAAIQMQRDGVKFQMKFTFNDRWRSRGKWYFNHPSATYRRAPEPETDQPQPSDSQQSAPELPPMPEAFHEAMDKLCVDGPFTREQAESNWSGSGGSGFMGHLWRAAQSAQSGGGE